MKGQLASAPKSLEILLALGNLYYQERRYPDAIGWYDQAIALAEPVWRDYLALPASERAKEPAPAVKQACARTQARGFEPLANEARARATKKDSSGAAFCYRAALEPWISARIQRANAKLLAGDAAGAVADHEAVLARIPDQPDALYFLGLALAETAEGNVGQLERARALWSAWRSSSRTAVLEDSEARDRGAGAAHRGGAVVARGPVAAREHEHAASSVRRGARPARTVGHAEALLRAPHPRLAPPHRARGARDSSRARPARLGEGRDPHARASLAPPARPRSRPRGRRRPHLRVRGDLLLARGALR
jgi:tetratricopeptide (TPR) repeat protein